MNSKKINTIDNITRTSEIRYDKLDIKNNKPVLDIEGIDSEVFTFSVKLSKSLGIDPLSELAKWRVAQYQYRAGNLIIGSKNYSANHPLIIKKITDEHQTFDGFGNVTAIDLSIELMESPITKRQSKTTVTTENTAPVSKSTAGTVSIITDSIHIRAGAGTNNKVIGYAQRGQLFTVYGMVNGWYDLGNGRYIAGNTNYISYREAT